MTASEVLHLGISAEVRFQRSTPPTHPGGPRSTGTFPLRWVDVDGGGRAVALPVGPQETVWLSLRSHEPTALVPVVDGRNARTGAPRSSSLDADPQGYVVIPEQRWIDRVQRHDGGSGPMLGPAAPSGGVSAIQLIAHRLRSAAFARWWAATGQDDRVNHFGEGEPVMGGGGPGTPGGGGPGTPGGGDPAADPHGIEAWDPDPFVVVDVVLLDPAAW